MLTMRARHSGFSLIELAVTLAVLGILVVAAAPSLATWLQNTRIRNQAESIQNGLQLARMEAVRRNQTVGFWLVSATDPRTLDSGCTLSSSGPSWVVSVSSPEGHCTDTPSQTAAPMIVESHAAGDGGTGTSISATASDGATAASSVTFNGFGQVVAAAASVAVVDVGSAATGDGYRALRVMVSSGGSVRTCDPNPDLAGTDPRKC